MKTVMVKVLIAIIMLALLGIYDVRAASNHSSSNFTEYLLKNATYSLWGEKITFKNGHYKNDNMPPSSMDIDMIAFGDLNNDNKIDAAIIYRVNENWTSVNLIAVINYHGKALAVAEQGLCMFPGEGNFIKKVVIENGIVIVNMLTHKKGDKVYGSEWVPPTVNSTFKFKLVGKRFFDVSSKSN